MRLIDLNKMLTIYDEDNNAVIFGKLDTAAVEAIPIKWIKRYWDSHRVDDMTIWNMLNAWEKENENI